MLDLFLMMSLGFLGSFGHCVGMCGPISAAFSLTNAQAQTNSQTQKPQPQHAQSEQTQPEHSPPPQFLFNTLLNLGRLLSYTLVGAAIGGVGSVLIAGGQMAGVGSLLRQGLAMLTGSLLIWFGLRQIKPELLPPLPYWSPLAGKTHHRLSRAMAQLSVQLDWWTPILLGGLWGLIPCGFLYAAQIRAAETGDLWQGAAMMAAFGLGTFPTMLGVGLTTAKLTADRRGQLFRLGGWITLGIGGLTLLRTDAMIDGTGQGSLLLLMLALVARPLSRIWPQPLQYRRVLGVGAFVLALAHTGHMASHTLQWRMDAIAFMLPQHQLGLKIGILALLLMVPAALTSFDKAQQKLGDRWRSIHLWAICAFVFAVVHSILIGSHYLGGFRGDWSSQARTGALIAIALGVLLVRLRWVWTVLTLDRFYAAPMKANSAKES